MATPGKPYDFNSYAAGNKIYGGGRSAPNIGMALDPLGYKERDLATKARRDAMLKWLQAKAKGNFMSSSFLGGPRS